MLQAGVHILRDRVTGQHRGSGFVEFLTETDAEYAINVMNKVELFGKPLHSDKVRKRVANIGAKLFIGNLDLMLDETALYKIFSNFGKLLKNPTISRGTDGGSKG